MTSDVPFTRRKRSDLTHESICMTCFLTVGPARDEAALEVQEKAHNCEREIRRECSWMYFLSAS